MKTFINSFKSILFMMLKSEILSVVKDQKNGLKNINLGISREHIKEIKLNDSFAYVISGIRRCGKSTLLHQIRVNQKDYAYFNFEDTRLNNFRVEDFEKLKECLLEIYGKTNTFFFDEIQNIKKWELFIRQLLDNKAKILITGSNASLLSKELGTRLTGRNLRKELFPFSYKEYLKFKSQKQNFNSFEEYLVNGGFPDYLKYKNEEILQELLNNTLYRDIVVRHRLKESKTLKDLTLYLLSNIGKEYSYNSLKKTFNFGSINTLISYISYLEDAYVLFTISRFDYSLKKQIISPKKIYCVDNGLITTNTLSSSKDKGRLLENFVLLYLKNNFSEIYYYKEQDFECDFIVKEKDKIVNAYQVCLNLDESNKEREINGLIKTLKKFKLTNGKIITLDQSDSLDIDGFKIDIIPGYNLY